MATPNYYVPLLRWRMGEYQALEKLSVACKARTVPLIEVLPPDSSGSGQPRHHSCRSRPSALRAGTRSRARQPTVLRWRVAGKWKWWTGRASGTCGSYGCNARGCAAGGCRTQTAISGKGQRPAHRLG